jgi:uncharacterized membrane protein
MRTLLVGLTIVSAFGLAGCTKESDKGGPGATQAAKSNEDAKNAEDMMFTAKPPTITTTVEQGGRDEVTLSIDRGDKFKETVTLTFKPPAGVSVNPATASIPAGSEEAKVTIEAAADAAPGDTHIDVTFTPETGKAVPKTFPITVTKK